MSFKFEEGDRITSKVSQQAYYVTAIINKVDGQTVYCVTWIDNNGVPRTTLYFDLSPEAMWIKSVHRDGERVYPYKFKFGDKVRHTLSPGVHGIFIKYNEDGLTANIAYPDTSEGVEASSLKYLDLV